MITAVVLGAGHPDSAVVSVSVREMLGAAEFVFKGRVPGQEAVRPAGSCNIFTKVLFSVQDVFKGNHDVGNTGS